MTTTRPFPRTVASSLITLTLSFCLCFYFPAQASFAAPNQQTIADIQGAGFSSPFSGQTVSTRGVVTAAYPTGGLKGFYLQSAGSGGDQQGTAGQSEAIFIYSPQGVSQVEIGDYVQVSGEVSERFEQTQISVAANNLRVLAQPHAPVKPIKTALPSQESEREALEGMLLLPSGPITVTDNYNTHRYGEIGLVNGSQPLRAATDVVSPGQEAIDYEEHAAQQVFYLDDGASVDYTRGASETPLPYLAGSNPVRVGAELTFKKPVVLTFNRDQWRLQPSSPVTGDNEETTSPVSWSQTRPQEPEKVGGAFSIASFNVLNYFSTTGDQLEGCRFYQDRQQNPISVQDGCQSRGAANQENLQRQQDKIVAAIHTMDSAVLALEEIENSAVFGKNRDEALNHLLAGLNSSAGFTKWAALAPSGDIPANEDVIRTAFIYQPSRVKPLGQPKILADQAFANARQPLAQAFEPVKKSRTSQKFVAIVNHFKSKGSGSGPGNEDSKDGQGASNASRIAQAQALADFAADQKKLHQTSNLILLGDFNSYSQEDPMRLLYDRGFVDTANHYGAGPTYLYNGRLGSLDHILVSQEFLAQTTGTTVWNINAAESVGLEYSRYNSNITNLYAPDPYRSSDHNPQLLGFNLY